jgi:hypothetical protein
LLLWIDPMIDLRDATYDDFVTFVFDHPAYEGQDLEVEGNRIIRVIEQRPQEWFWDVDFYWSDVPSDPSHVLALLTQLFTRAGELRGRFTPRQIGQGFKLLLGPAAEELFTYPIWNDQLPWEPRELLIRSTLSLYDGLFDVEVEIEHVPFMYWDMLLGYRYAEEPIAIPESKDDARMQIAAAEVIRSMLLDRNGPWSGPAALHGAHHVNHPIAFDAVRQWLADGANGDEHYREYAQRVLVGDAM